MSDIKINPEQAQSLVHITALHGAVTLKPSSEQILADIGHFSAVTEAGYEWFFDEKGRLRGWNDPEDLDGDIDEPR